MPKSLTKLEIVARRDPRLQCVNEKIAKLAALKPWGDIYTAFSLAAHLAAEAIDAALEIGQMPGVDHVALQPVLEFWQRAQDCNHAAALTCAGGNQTLVEALVAYGLLRKVAE